MQDVMLDLETMGNGPQAAIIAIGAVEFDIPTQQIGERLYGELRSGDGVRGLTHILFSPKNLKPTVRNLTVGAAKKLEDGCTGKRTPDQAARF